MNTDADLLGQFARQNSQSAFAELVRQHVNLVYSIALPRVGGDVHAARDVSQAVFIALARKAGDLADRTTLAGWLYLTTQNQAAQWVRSEQRRHAREQEAHTMNELSQPSEINWHQLRPVLDEAMQELSESEREVIVLRFFEQLPLAAVGHALLVSEDAARMRVDRALEKLHSLLSRRGISSTAAALAGVLGSQLVAAPENLAASISEAVASASITAGTTGTALSFGTAKLVTGGLVAAAAVATAVFVSRGTDHVVKDAPATPVIVRLAAPGPVSAPAPAVVAAAPTAVAAASATQAHEEEPESGGTSESRRAAIERQVAGYRPLLDKLDLSAEQRRIFESLLKVNRQRHGDLREFHRTEGKRTEDPDIEALGAQADDDLVAQIQTQFGNAALAAFEHFNETGPMREFVYHLGTRLASTSAPLTSAQADSLVEILAQHSRDAEGRVSGDPKALDLEGAIADAQTLLTAPQIAALRQLRSSKR